MKRKAFLYFLYIATVLFAAACALLTPSADQDGPPRGGDLSPTPTVFIPTPTATLAPELTPTTDVSLTPTQGASSAQQFLTYIKDGHLLVTDVTNGVQGGTTQYTVTGQSDQVTDLVWSPSGEFIAFVSATTGMPHIFTVFALGQSSPTDLGPGSAPAWSPDSTSIAFVGGTYPNENISITNVDNPSPRQLTFEPNYAWGRPVFTPDGASLIVAGADRNNMGAQGNTSFTLDSLALDGSGTRTPLPGATPMEGVRLPYDLRFSPDGTRLAFSTSFHLSACASPGAYYVSDPDGGNRQELVSPSLKPFIDTLQDRYPVGFSYTWSPASDGVIALGNVVDCNFAGPASGQVIAGPQMSTIGLDGSEGLIIPGFFYGISMDRTGTLIAAAHFLEGFADLNPNVKIYSAQSGQRVLTLGPGINPQFQP